MQNFDELKNLWQTTKNDLPSAKEILAQIDTVRKKMIRKNIFGITLLSLTFIFIIWIGIHYDFEMITTKIGILITLISIIIGIVFNTRLANMLLKQGDPTLDNNHYLQQLIEFRNQQRRIQTKGISLYFILLTSGLMLYMYEFAARDLKSGITAYSITLGWIAFNWFYIRKKTIAKHEKEINGQIENIEKLMTTFKNE
jgi:hypothetical protein